MNVINPNKTLTKIYKTKVRVHPECVLGNPGYLEGGWGGVLKNGNGYLELQSTNETLNTN